MGDKKWIDGNVVNISKDELDVLQERGYNEDILPKPLNKRTMNRINYFTLWMGSIHNIPNYAAVGGFLFLGLSPINVIFALILSGVAVALVMIFNGMAGSKYGIPFSMQLRLTYGTMGSKLPGFLRGCVAAIAWFGLQNYSASLALKILLGKIWPGFLNVYPNFNFFGLDFAEFIAFTLFWLVNLAIGIGGGTVLNRFTAILNPLIYIIFIGMAIWSVRVSGGLGTILAFSPASSDVHPSLAVYLMIIASVLSVWAGPAASVSDFTQEAKSTKEQVIGQSLSLVIGYIIFAFSSVLILIGGSIHYKTNEWNILNIVDKWDNYPAIILAMLVLLMTTISTNATGNIVPAAYQLAALFPNKVNYKKGVLIAGVLSYIIMPWKLMQSAHGIMAFLNFIGALLGPVIGVMLAQYFVIKRQTIDINQLYMDKKVKDSRNSYIGINKSAYLATILGLVLSFLGNVVPVLKSLSSFSFLIGSFSSFLIYIILKMVRRKKDEI